MLIGTLHRALTCDWLFALTRTFIHTRPPLHTPTNAQCTLTHDDVFIYHVKLSVCVCVQAVGILHYSFMDSCIQ